MKFSDSDEHFHGLNSSVLNYHTGICSDFPFLAIQTVFYLIVPSFWISQNSKALLFLFHEMQFCQIGLCFHQLSAKFMEVLHMLPSVLHLIAASVSGHVDVGIHCKN